MEQCTSNTQQVLKCAEHFGNVFMDLHCQSEKAGVEGDLLYVWLPALALPGALRVLGDRAGSQLEVMLMLLSKVLRT